jgi:hypothetical protein
MNYEETKESKELKPYELVEGQRYYLTVGSQNIQKEKALFVEKRRSKIGNTEYFFEINGRTVLDNMNYGLFDTSNGRYWHVYRIDPEYSYIAESEFNNLFAK